MTSPLPIEAAVLPSDYFKKNTVECEKNEYCPEAIGQLISEVKGERLRCTGSLVAANIVLTASHCLLNHFKKESSKSQGHFVFILPKTLKNQEERLPLDNVLFDAQDSLQEKVLSDVAFVKLALPSKRTPMQLDSSGIGEGENLTIFKIHDSEANHSKLFMIRCHAIQHSFVYPRELSNQSRKFIAGACPLVVTDSGAPALSLQGKIKGVMTEKFYRGQMDRLSLDHLQTALHTQDIQEVFDQVSAGSNLACIRPMSQSFHGELPKSCESQNSISIADFLEQEMKIYFQKNFDPDTWYKQQQSGVQWQLTLDKKPKTEEAELIFSSMTASPYCLLNKSDSIDNSILKNHYWNYILKISADLVPTFEKREMETRASTLQLLPCADGHREPYIFIRQN